LTSHALGSISVWWRLVYSRSTV